MTARIRANPWRKRKERKQGFVPRIWILHKEIRLPWNDEFDRWHLKHFPESVHAHVFLDQISLMEEFLTADAWAVVPFSVGYRLREKGIPIQRLTDAPPGRMIWYLVPKEKENPLVKSFFFHLRIYLKTLQSEDFETKESEQLYCWLSWKKDSRGRFCRMLRRITIHMPKNLPSVRKTGGLFFPFA